MTEVTQETKSPHARVCARAFLLDVRVPLRAHTLFFRESVTSVTSAKSLRNLEKVLSLKRHLLSLRRNRYGNNENVVSEVRHA